MWKMNTSPMWSLGVFTPDFLEPLPESCADIPWVRLHYRKTSLELQWCRWLRERCYIEVTEPEVRSPDYNYQIITEDSPFDPVSEWHADGCQDGKACYLAAWSNNLSTEIIDPETGSIYQAPPGEVYMWNNRKFKHRVPEGALSRLVFPSRFFARGNYRTTTILNDVPGVYALTL